MRQDQGRRSDREWARASSYPAQREGVGGHQADEDKSSTTEDQIGHDALQRAQAFARKGVSTLFEKQDAGVSAP